MTRRRTKANKLQLLSRTLYDLTGAEWQLTMSIALTEALAHCVTITSDDRSWPQLDGYFAHEPNIVKAAEEAVEHLIGLVQAEKLNRQKAAA